MGLGPARSLGLGPARTRGREWGVGGMGGWAWVRPGPWAWVRPGPGGEGGRGIFMKISGSPPKIGGFARKYRSKIENFKKMEIEIWTSG